MYVSVSMCVSLCVSMCICVSIFFMCVSVWAVSVCVCMYLFVSMCVCVSVRETLNRRTSLSPMEVTIRSTTAGQS